MSFFEYPKLLSFNNTVVKYMNMSDKCFSIEIPVREVKTNKSEMDKIIIEKIDKLYGRVTNEGLICSIIELKSRTPGLRNSRRTNGGIIYDCIVSCVLIDLDNNTVICNVELLASDSKGIFYGRYKDKINITVDSGKYPQFNLKIGSKINIRAEDIKGLELGSYANKIAVLGLPFILYDIPLEKRSMHIFNSGTNNFKFNPKFDTNGAPFLGKYGYYPNNFDKLEKFMSGTKFWKTNLKIIINPYDMLKPKPKFAKMFDVNELYSNLNKKYNLKISNPITRSYFKLVEIIYFNNIKPKNMNFASIADAPGGFTQAFIDMFGRKSNVFTTSIKSSIKYDTVIQKNKNINIDMLKTGDGDITNIDNIRYIQSLSNKFSIVTCDGAFDHDKYLKTKEVLHTQLLLAEMICCLLLTEKTGTCIVKLYTRFTDPNVKLIYWFSTYFKNCTIYKPRSSRIATQEVYIIGNEFKGSDSLISKAIDTLSLIKSQSGDYNRFFTNIIDVKLPDMFVVSLFKYNIYLRQIRKFCYNFANEINQEEIDVKRYIDYQLIKCKKFLS